MKSYTFTIRHLMHQHQMTKLALDFRRLILLLSLSVFFSAANFSMSSLAIDFIEIIEEQKIQPHENNNGFRLEHFGQWIFNEQIDTHNARKKLQSKLDTEADAIQTLFQLSKEQKDKLILAGLGDIQAFMHEYDQARDNFKKNMHDQQAMQKVWQEIQPLQTKYRKLFSKGSLFAKIMEHLLDEQQLTILQSMVREQCRFKYLAAVRQTILQIDQVAPIKHKNRQKLLELIEQHTYPPKAIPNNNQAHFLTYYVFRQLDEIPKDELKSLFSEPTWNILRQQIQQGVGMKRHLDQQGLVPDVS